MEADGVAGTVKCGAFAPARIPGLDKQRSTSVIDEKAHGFKTLVAGTAAEAVPETTQSCAMSSHKLAHVGMLGELC